MPLSVLVITLWLMVGSTLVDYMHHNGKKVCCYTCLIVLLEVSIVCCFHEKPGLFCDLYSLGSYIYHKPIILVWLNIFSK